MSNCCLDTHCLKCCTETNMVLSNHDIGTLQQQGYDPTFFIEEHDGWLQLKNRHGRCVFHDGDRCTVYEHRPQGCTLYPVVYDKDRRCAILDKDCPQRQCFSLTTATTQQLYRLVGVLEKERAARHHSKNMHADP
ncbi:MAG: YkgJ family cysteine cluster protein [Candidatus Thermoplasmatota archaeon]|nr:YkgJ family cysteine cluster protein [Candidatus Thermoplasmatota archaeon]